MPWLLSFRIPHIVHVFLHSAVIVLLVCRGLIRCAPLLSPFLSLVSILVAVQLDLEPDFLTQSMLLSVSMLIGSLTVKLYSIKSASIGHIIPTFGSSVYSRFTLTRRKGGRFA